MQADPLNEVRPRIHQSHLSRRPTPRDPRRRDHPPIPATEDQDSVLALCMCHVVFLPVQSEDDSGGAECDRGALRSSELLGPLPGRVENGQNLDSLIGNPVRNDERSS